MTRAHSIADALAALQPEPGLVLLMCGMAGSGKTTFSQALELRGFARLSIDEVMWTRFGRHGIDYPAADYRSLLERAHAELSDRLAAVMARRTPAVVDSAFWNRADRDRHKVLVEQAGCRWQIVYMQTPLELVRNRLSQRNFRFDANAPYAITDDILTRYAAAFEPPLDEGAIVVVP
jgi:predicted kinase